MRTHLFLLVLALGVTVFSIGWHLPLKIPPGWNHQPKKRTLSGPALLVLGKKISINHAEIRDLMALPGIGPGRAQAILKYREYNGPFSQIRSIGGVPGIGDKTLREIEPLIDVQK